MTRMNGVTLYRSSTDGARPVIPVAVLEQLIEDVDNLPVWYRFVKPDMGTALNLRVVGDELVADVDLNFHAVNESADAFMLSIGTTVEGDNVSDLRVAACLETTWEAPGDRESMRTAYRTGVWSRG